MTEQEWAEEKWAEDQYGWRSQQGRGARNDRDLKNAVAIILILPLLGIFITALIALLSLHPAQAREVLLDVFTFIRNALP